MEGFKLRVEASEGERGGERERENKWMDGGMDRYSDGRMDR